MKAYATPHDALADALRLSGAMTLKQAAADLPYGGGKAVVAVPEVPPEARRSAERCCCGMPPSWTRCTART